ncbi:hypothetical protein [Flavobacterium reichenbachii]|uniref:DUF5018 domain-containing protein n=1 Tax=Flavobacterium reichenbachii TaxID=362418 RepID=A0A085ZI62_9FLAO|nr:hypothetical protein [Flavobacterium reichenbachii]KFF04126.1 hypothetical protein IW19_00650 [Flavobacterium reichenbachii]OXB15833.1 hypothetical protein B0A68_09210 [Flavobacterium reichenbachii]
MNKKNNLNTFLYAIGALFLSALFFSCDTEYIDKVNSVPGDVIKVSGYTHIESFIIKDTENNAISAALTTDNIVVTWSNYMALPATIKPEIVLGTDAVISPASGQEVPFKDGTVYTVTSKAGTKKQYTLKIDLRQKEPKAWNYNGGDVLSKGALLKMTNDAQTNAISDLWLNINETRVYFVSATDQTEYTAETVYVGSGETTGPFNTYGIYYFLPENIAVGMYDMRIKNGAYTLQNASVENRFKIEIIEPVNFSATLYGSPATKQIGETLEIRGALLNTTTSVEMYDSSNSAVIYPVEIVSLTPYRAVLKIPAGTPAGIYNRMRFRRGTSSTLTAYTVTVK